MIVVSNEKTVFYDVDDTLIMWEPGNPDDPRCIKVERQVEVSHPLNEVFYGTKYKTVTDYLLPHAKHIEQLKIHKTRGHFNVVWSAGGADWAYRAVQLLGIADYVDLIISKPAWAYDDKKPEEYMPKSQWIKDE